MTNAQRQQAFRNKLRDMVRFGALVPIANHVIRNKRSGDDWQVISYWPDYGYWKIERTYSAHCRDYTKSHLISSKVLETNYVEISSKAA